MPMSWKLKRKLEGMQRTWRIKPRDARKNSSRQPRNVRLNFCGKPRNERRKWKLQD